MGENTDIQYAHHTFNPWIGCTKVGPGCEHCYAEVRDRRKMLGPVSHWGPGAPRHRTSIDNWSEPTRWNRRCAEDGIRQRVFSASLADVFDNEVPAEWRADLFALIRATPNLDWLLITKRIGNAAKMAAAAGGWPSNVWLGATIVNQEEADRDILKLLDTEGPRFRFLSMEPLLGAVDLRWLRDGDTNALTGVAGLLGCPRMIHQLDWIIVGGESGPGARPMHPEWLISLRDQCEAEGVPFFFKQWGEHLPVLEHDAHGERYAYRRVGKKAAGRKLHGLTHDAVPA